MPTKTGVINIPIKLENDALQTALATLPFATDVKAIEDCTVEGKKHMNKKPQYSSCPSIGTRIGFASKPKIGGKDVTFEVMSEDDQDRVVTSLAETLGHK